MACADDVYFELFGKLHLTFILTSWQRGVIAITCRPAGPTV